MAGWNLKQGRIRKYDLNEDQIWSLFNYVFSDSSRKRNTYKFGLIKSLLDSAFDTTSCKQGIYYSYEDIFERFAGNYWNLVVKYNLKQMRKDAKSMFSKIETILKSSLETNAFFSVLEFDAIPIDERKRIIKQVTIECKKCVIGALYEDFDGTIYSFDLKAEGIYINPSIHEFMLKHKSEIEKLNYYSWAKFLEQVNDDNAIIRVIDKLELSTPKRTDLSVYCELLRREFEENTCFYCGRKLLKYIHVDHFIPWSFTKDDKIWNFVLSCPDCNRRKNDRLPSKNYIPRIIKRNSIIKEFDNTIVKHDFMVYSDDLIDRIWTYAKMNGFKEYKI